MYKHVIVASVACVLTITALTLPAPQSPSCPFPTELETFAIDVGRTPTIVADNLRQWINWQGGNSYVQVGRHERADATSEWAFKEYMFSTDLKITDVSFAAGGQTLYVAGIRSTGNGCEDVIEQWDITFPKGSLAIQVSPAPTRGTVAPLPFTSTITGTVVIGGGTFVSAAQRIRSPFTQKTVLYSGSGLGPFAAIEADPEQRFLLALPLSGSGLYSLDLTTPSSPPLLEFDAATLPHLGAVRRIVAYEHEDLGRFYWLYETKGDYIGNGCFSFIVDSENDGVFDASLTLDAGAAFAASPFHEYAKFVSLINTTDTDFP
ncbi:MAG: hypothetical protein QF860_03295 [Planctomycetota bacterium]|nr:hypothetical protein [Planctomycetota bacterium]